MTSCLTLHSHTKNTVEAFTFANTSLIHFAYTQYKSPHSGLSIVTSRSFVIVLELDTNWRHHTSLEEEKSRSTALNLKASLLSTAHRKADMKSSE